MSHNTCPPEEMENKGEIRSLDKLHSEFYLQRKKNKRGT